jgi:DNA adenine methylase
MFEYVPSPHTCYVEVWPCYERIFRKSPSPVEVCNDQGQMHRLFRMLREQPEVILAGIASDREREISAEEVSCYQQFIAEWHRSQQTKRGSVPTTVDALEESLQAPYRRLRTVLFEALDWRSCLERYNDPDALLTLQPPWTTTQRDEWAALHLRLRRSRSQWRLIVPRDVADSSHFARNSLVAQQGNVVCLAPLQ